jgi:hypothetical protein
VRIVGECAKAVDTQYSPVVLKEKRCERSDSVPEKKEHDQFPTDINSLGELYNFGRLSS